MSDRNFVAVTTSTSTSGNAAAARVTQAQISSGAGTSLLISLTTVANHPGYEVLSERPSVIQANPNRYAQATGKPFSLTAVANHPGSGGIIYKVPDVAIQSGRLSVIQANLCRYAQAPGTCNTFSLPDLLAEKRLKQGPVTPSYTRKRPSEHSDSESKRRAAHFITTEEVASSLSCRVSGNFPVVADSQTDLTLHNLRRNVTDVETYTEQNTVKEELKRALEVLVKNPRMPLIEIASITGLPETELRYFLGELAIKHDTYIFRPHCQDITYPLERAKNARDDNEDYAYIIAREHPPQADESPVTYAARLLKENCKIDVRQLLALTGLSPAVIGALICINEQFQTETSLSMRTISTHKCESFMPVMPEHVKSTTNTPSGTADRHHPHFQGLTKIFHRVRATFPKSAGEILENYLNRPLKNGVNVSEHEFSVLTGLSADVVKKYISLHESYLPTLSERCPYIRYIKTTYPIQKDETRSMYVHRLWKTGHHLNISELHALTGLDPLTLNELVHQHNNDNMDTSHARDTRSGDAIERVHVILTTPVSSIGQSAGSFPLPAAPGARRTVIQHASQSSLNVLSSEQPQTVVTSSPQSRVQSDGELVKVKEELQPIPLPPPAAIECITLSEQGEVAQVVPFPAAPVFCDGTKKTWGSAINRQQTLSSLNMNNFAKKVKFSGDLLDKFSSMTRSEAAGMKKHIIHQLHLATVNGTEEGKQAVKPPRLGVRPSFIQASDGDMIYMGKGVFNDEGTDIQAGTFIGFYEGRLMKSSDFRKAGSVGTLKYCWETSSRDDLVVMGGDEGNALSFVNTGRMGSGPALGKNNVAAVEVGDVNIAYVALETIKHGDELFVNYGPGYNPDNCFDKQKRAERVAAVWNEKKALFDKNKITLPMLALYHDAEIRDVLDALRAREANIPTSQRYAGTTHPGDPRVLRLNPSVKTLLADNPLPVMIKEEQPSDPDVSGHSSSFQQSDVPSEAVPISPPGDRPPVLTPLDTDDPLSSQWVYQRSLQSGGNTPTELEKTALNGAGHTDMGGLV